MIVSKKTGAMRIGLAIVFAFIGALE